MIVEPFVLVLAAALLGLVLLAAWHVRRPRPSDKELDAQVHAVLDLMEREWNWDGLTRRQREVAELVGQGKRNYEIARELTISVRTVERHLEDIYGNLGVRNRTELIRALRDRRD